MDKKINFFCAIAVWKLQITLIARLLFDEQQPTCNEKRTAQAQNEQCKFAVKERDS